MRTRIRRRPAFKPGRHRRPDVKPSDSCGVREFLCKGPAQPTLTEQLNKAPMELIERFDFKQSDFEGPGSEFVYTYHADDMDRLDHSEQTRLLEWMCDTTNAAMRRRI